MIASQGDLALLEEEVAQSLLHSTRVAHLAYMWEDGTPRVSPMWFLWTGSELVMATPIKAPKVHMLTSGTPVALCIDSDEWPYKVLQIRGVAEVTTVDGVVPEYAAAAERYFGVEGGKAWIETAAKLSPLMARIVVKPTWVGLLDFEHRFPSALASAMGAA